MYLVGGEHPHKIAARQSVESLIGARERMVTDAEAFQEILHRYTAIRRPAAIQPAFDALRSLVDEVYAVDEGHVYAAKDILAGHPSMSSRDALHLAVMRANGVARILSFDTGFDGVPGVTRLP